MHVYNPKSELATKNFMLFFLLRTVCGFKNPWITTELKKMMHLRDQLKIKAIRSGDAIDWNNFKRSRNNVNNAIKIAKKSYYSKSFTACDGKLTQDLGDH